MSYDILLFPVPAGTSIEAAYEALEGASEPVADVAAFARRSRLVNAITAAFPGLVPAVIESPTSVVALHIGELGGSVSVHLDGVGLQFAYWDLGRADEVAALILGVVSLVTAETGWRAWDPQRGAEVTTVDRDVTTATFTAGVAATAAIGATAARAEAARVGTRPTALRRFLRWLAGDAS